MSFLEDALRHAMPSAESAGPMASAIGAVILGQIFKGSTAAAAPVPAPGTVDQSAVSDGLGGLLGKLEQAGLGDIARSWIGTGPNQSIDPHQLGSALGNEAIAVLASKTGISADVLQAQLAKYLPVVIDHLTPHGHIPTQQA